MVASITSNVNWNIHCTLLRPSSNKKGTADCLLFFLCHDNLHSIAIGLFSHVSGSVFRGHDRTHAKEMSLVAMVGWGGEAEIKSSFFPSFYGCSLCCDSQSLVSCINCILRWVRGSPTKKQGSITMHYTFSLVHRESQCYLALQCKY